MHQGRGSPIATDIAMFSSAQPFKPIGPQTPGVGFACGLGAVARTAKLQARIQSGTDNAATAIARAQT
jgi:hypothetical protein